MGPEHGLHLIGPDGLGSGPDGIVRPAAHDEPPVVEGAEITGAEPSVGGERFRGGTGVAPVTVHERWALQLDLAVLDASGSAAEADAVVGDAAAGLGKAVGGHDPRSESCGGVAERTVHRSPTDQKRAEAREVPLLGHEPGEHRGHQSDTSSARRGQQPDGVERFVHDERRAAEDAAQQDEQATSVSGRKTRDPEVAVVDAQRVQRAGDGRTQGGPRKLRQLRFSPGSRGRHDDPRPLGIDRSRVGENDLLIRGYQDRGPGSLQQALLLPAREPMVHGHERDPRLRMLLQDLEPRRPGGHVVSHEFAGGCPQPLHVR